MLSLSGLAESKGGASLKMKASSLSLFARHVLMGFGSALVLSLYSVVDAIMVGRYEGERGMAAVATIVPIWTIALSVGLLFGIGGGIFVAKCLGEGDKEKASRKKASVKMSKSTYSRFFSSTPADQVEDIVVKALELYFQSKEGMEGK